MDPKTKVIIKLKAKLKPKIKPKPIVAKPKPRVTKLPENKWNRVQLCAKGRKFDIKQLSRIYKKYKDTLTVQEICDIVKFLQENPQFEPYYYPGITDEELAQIEIDLEIDKIHQQSTQQGLQFTVDQIAAIYEPGLTLDDVKNHYGVAGIASNANQLAGILGSLPAGLYRYRFLDNGDSARVAQGTTGDIYLDGISNLDLFQEHFTSDWWRVDHYLNNGKRIQISRVSEMDEGGHITLMENQVYRLSDNGKCVPESICAHYESWGQAKLELYRETGEPKHKKLATRYRNKAKRIMEYFLQNFEDGVPHPMLEPCCNELSVNLELNHVSTGKVYRYKYGNDPIVRLVNIAFDHVDLSYSNLKHVFLPKPEFDQKKREIMQSSKSLIQVFCKFVKSVRTVYAFTMHDTMYVDEQFRYLLDDTMPNTCKEYLQRNSKLFMSSEDPYYHFIINCTRIPVSMATESFRYLTEDGYVEKLGCYSTDMRKCFLQFKKSPYYEGVPIGVSEYGYNPSLKYPDGRYRQGWWKITSQCTDPYLGPIEGNWTTPHLRMFTDLGYTYTITFGAWDYKPVDLEDLPEDSYQRIIGCMSERKSTVKTQFYDPNNVLCRLDHDENAIDHIYYRISKKDKWRNGCNLSSFLYAFATSLVIPFAHQHKAIAVKVDSIITETPIVHQVKVQCHKEGHTECCALWHQCEPYKYSCDIKGTHDCKEEPDKCQRTGKNRSMFWAMYAVAGRSYAEKYKLEGHYALPESYNGNLEYTVFPEGNLRLTGQGGTGKTFTTEKILGWANPLYIVPTIKLGESKVPSVFQQYDTYNSWHSMKEGGLSYVRYRIPRIIVCDEVTLTQAGFLEETFSRAEEWGIRLIVIGDEGQIKSQFNRPDLWDYLKQKIPNELYFKMDRRSKCSILAGIKKEMHECSIKGDLDGIMKLLGHFQSYKKAPPGCHEIKFYKSTIVSRKPYEERLQELIEELHKGAISKEEAKSKYEEMQRENEIYVPPPKGAKIVEGTHTIDSLQGDTISEPHILVVTRLTKREDIPALIYTMVSRFERMEDIYVHDTTKGILYHREIVAGLEATLERSL